MQKNKQFEIAGRVIPAIQKRDAETREAVAQYARAAFVPGSVSDDSRTATFVASTGARGLRRPVFGEDYYEELEISEQAIRLGRLNNGAPLLKDHSQHTVDTVIGVVERAYIEAGNLMVVVRFSNDDDGEKYFRKVRDGILQKVSVGYRVHEFQAYQREGELDVLRAVDWEPFEVSLVSIAFDDDAKVRSDSGEHTCKVIYKNRSRKADPSKEEKTMELEKRAAQLGISRRDGETDEQLRARVEAAEQARADEAKRDQDAARAQAVEAERKRTTGIFDAVRKAGLETELATSLVSEGASLEDAHKRIIDAIAAKAENSNAGNVNTRTSIDTSSDAERLMEIRSGVSDVLQMRVNPAHKPGEAANQFRGLTLMEMARKLLEMGGADTRGMERMALATRAMTSSDLPHVLADVANKTLLQAYQEVQRTFTVLGRRTTINDFKAVNRVRLGGFSDLRPKNEAGEFEHGIIKDEKESYALATYGRQVKFTREMMINDDLDALSRMVALFGAAAARLESQLVWSHLLGNPVMGDGTALFHADHKNLGSASAINASSVSESRKRMRKQTDNNGNAIEVMPSFLVVGPDKETEAEQFLSGTLRPTKTADVVPERLRNSLDLIVENRITGNQWYTFASPSQIDTFEYAYLTGQEGVYIESDPQFLTGDIAWGVRHDFAAKAIDWRGMDKNPGA